MVVINLLLIYIVMVAMLVRLIVTGWNAMVFEINNQLAAAPLQRTWFS